MTESQERINNFLHSLEFKKKRFGGVDPQDVLDKFCELDKLYETAFAEKMKNAKEHIAKLSEQLDEREKEAEQLSEECAQSQKQFDVVLKESDERKNELASVNIKCKELNEAKEILEKENVKLNEKIALLAASEKKSADDQEAIALLQKSNAELNENNVQLERHVAELQKQIASLKEEKKAELNACSDECFKELLEKFKEQLAQKNSAKKEDVLFSTQKMLDALKKSNSELYDIRKQLDACVVGLQQQLDSINKEDANSVGECFEESFKNTIAQYKNQLIKETEAENEHFLTNTQKKVDSILSEAKMEIERLRNGGFVETEKTKQVSNNETDRVLPEIPTTFSNNETVHSAKNLSAFWRSGLKT